jgi:hypothetical protein
MPLFNTDTSYADSDKRKELDNVRSEMRRRSDVRHNLRRQVKKKSFKIAPTISLVTIPKYICMVPTMIL